MELKDFKVGEYYTPSKDLKYTFEEKTYFTKDKPYKCVDIINDGLHGIVAKLECNDPLHNGFHIFAWKKYFSPVGIKTQDNQTDISAELYDAFFAGRDYGELLVKWREKTGRSDKPGYMI